MFIWVLHCTQGSHRGAAMFILPRYAVVLEAHRGGGRGRRQRRRRQGRRARRYGRRLHKEGRARLQEYRSQGMNRPRSVAPWSARDDDIVSNKRNVINRCAKPREAKGKPAHGTNGLPLNLANNGSHRERRRDGRRGRWRQRCRHRRREERRKHRRQQCRNLCLPHGAWVSSTRHS